MFSFGFVTILASLNFEIVRSRIYVFLIVFVE